jgi:hypothetical protein
VENAVALSDSCFDFLEAVSHAARELADAAHWYSSPDNPLRYGEEVDGLRRACMDVVDSPYDPEAGARLLRLAASVMRYHDTPPGSPDLPEQQQEMKALIRLLQSELNPDDAAAVPAIVENVVNQTPYTENAVKRLKTMLPKLGKAAGDMAGKIIANVASEAVKKTLGL